MIRWLAQVCRSPWKVTGGSSRAAAHAAASGRCWWLLPQGRPSSRSSIVSPPARPAQTPARNAAACRSSGTCRGLPLLASTTCSEGASGWKSRTLRPDQLAVAAAALQRGAREPAEGGGQALSSRRASSSPR
jgi:hypothetical protein